MILRHPRLTHAVLPAMLLAMLATFPAWGADDKDDNDGKHTVVTVDYGLKHHAFIPLANGKKPNIATIFIGGADEHKTDQNLENSDLFNKLTVGDNYYAEYTQAKEIDTLLNALPKAKIINIIAVREGSITAGKIVVAHPDRITRLYTLDPPGFTFSNVTEIKQNVKNWEDFTQTDPKSDPVPPKVTPAAPAKDK